MTDTVEVDLLITGTTPQALQGRPPAEDRTRWLPLAGTEIRIAGTWRPATQDMADSLRGATARLRISRQRAREKDLLHPTPETPRLI
jgi:hypothetical protein